jgi:hypothetical protein
MSGFLLFILLYIKASLIETGESVSDKEKEKNIGKSDEKRRVTHDINRGEIFSFCH